MNDTTALEPVSASPEIPPAMVYRAISDPGRRAMLDLLAEHPEMAVGDLCQSFEFSQPAVSQHLKVLQGAGLVSSRKDGRRRMYRLQPEPLRHVYDWVSHYEKFWNDKLDALGRFLDGELNDA